MFKEDKKIRQNTINVLSESGIRINTLTKLFIILLLYDKPRHGYELMKELKRILPYRINPEQVYPFLKTMWQKNLAEISERGERDKKVYRLTNRGMELVRQLLDRFEDILKIFLKEKIKVCVNCGAKIIEGGHVEVINGEELTFCCVHCAENYKKRIGLNI